MNGLLGQRFNLSRVNRLRHQEEDHLLFPFQLHCPVGLGHPNRPRKEIYGDWQGEYLGTWMDAAVLTAWNSGDYQLRNKIMSMFDAWIATQEANGYFGTYDGDDRWKSWDLWIHAHDIIGLVSYYKYTGDEKALNAAIRAADCVLAAFGPGKRFVHSTGWYNGMSSSSILEPMLWLYFETGEKRFLEWGMWLVEVDWEAPEGPHTLSVLLNNGSVADVGGGKGIEMLTNFVGLLELYRATKNERYLTAVVNAWNDIVQHQLYITGTSSTGEFFSGNYLLQNDGVYRIGETCVSMGWMYLTLSLGRLTGDARYFDMAETVIYNHLLGAQAPDGKGWAYYLGLRDHKRYRWHTEPECCPSRGVRAVAQLPQHVLAVDSDGIAVNLYESSTGQITLENGMEVALKMETGYPFDGHITLHVSPSGEGKFAMKLRLPGWCEDFALQVNGETQSIQPNDQGYLVLSRKWAAGDQIDLTLEMPVRIVVDRLGNPGHIAVVRGPLVYAADRAYLPDNRVLDDILLEFDSQDPTNNIALVEDEQTGHVHCAAHALLIRGGTGTPLWRAGGRYHDIVAGTEFASLERIEARLVPFFDAGNRDPDCYRDGIWGIGQDHQSRVVFQVWLPYVWTDK
jgi:DUF1680 family protein